jgi:hypothetical protein
LKAPAVKEALDGYVKVKFQAQEPDSPSVSPILKHFGAVGLPTYVILRPKGGDSVGGNAGGTPAPPGRK